MLIAFSVTPLGVGEIVDGPGWALDELFSGQPNMGAVKQMPPGSSLPDISLMTFLRRQLLIRMAVRYGAPIGNSQSGSQREGPIGTIPDTLAVLAVDGDLSFGIPAPHTDGA